MDLSNKIRIAIATNAHRDNIYRIRHEVYGSELRQHQENEKGLFQDALDEFNTYIIAQLNGDIVGFVSVTPPDQNRYSIDKYISREVLPFEISQNLFEIRILTVVKAHRNKPIAILLMKAAFRWIEAQGGLNIMAIGRIEVLDMYLKLGFQSMNHRFQAGAVTFELLYGNVNKLSTYDKDNYKELFLKLYKNTIWDLGVSFFKPAECYHGGAFFDAIGIEFDDLNRRKTIINADVLDAWFPPSPSVINELEQHLSWICKTSPPTDCKGMATVIAQYRGVQPENILPGAGSSDLIFLSFREWLNASSRVLILDPTYGEYAHVLESIIKCHVDRMILSSDNGYVVNLEKLIAISENNYDLIVLVNPNSPTGQHIPREKLEAAIQCFPSTTRVWVDETYVEYAGVNQSLEQFAAKSNNVVVCKSMSKVYALSGLRSAYLCASPYQLEILRSITPPWAVSLPSQIAAVLAMKDADYYAKRYAETHSLRDELMHELLSLNAMEIIPTTTNFILCHLLPKGPNAEMLVSRCREKNLFIRNVSNMGTQFGTHTIRIAVKDKETNMKMVKILKSVLTEENIIEQHV